MDKLLNKMKLRSLDCTGKLRSDLQRKACGGHADVFLGYLEDGMVVAIKRARFIHDGASIKQIFFKVSPSVDLGSIVLFSCSAATEMDTRSACLARTGSPKHPAATGVHYRKGQYLPLPCNGVDGKRILRTVSQRETGHRQAFLGT